MLIKSDYATHPFTEDGKKWVDEISFRLNLTPFYPFFNKKNINYSQEDLQAKIVHRLPLRDIFCTCSHKYTSRKNKEILDIDGLFS